MYGHMSAPSSCCGQRFELLPLLILPNASCYRSILATVATGPHRVHVPMLGLRSRSSDVVMSLARHADKNF